MDTVGPNWVYNKTDTVELMVPYVRRYAAGGVGGPCAEAV